MCLFNKFIVTDLLKFLAYPSDKLNDSYNQPHSYKQLALTSHFVYCFNDIFILQGNTKYRTCIEPESTASISTAKLAR